MEEIKTKVCSKCGREWPLSEFYKKSTSKDGLQSYCKACSKKLAIEYAQKSREKKKAHKIEDERIEFEGKYKIYTCKELAPFTPRQLMLELKARGYAGDLLYREVKVTEHRINLSTLD